MLLDAIGTIGSTIALFAILIALTSRLTHNRTQRIWLAIIAGAWVGTAMAATAAHAFQRATGPIVLLALFATPMIVVAVLAAFSARARATLLSVPMPLLIQLNLIRLEGALFLFLAADGRLAGPFPYSAGIGDVITGAFALPVAWMAMRGNARWPVAAWNVFGTLDLVAAVLLGVLSQNGSPIQLIQAGVGSAAITTMPWVLIPTVLVPFFLITHAVIFAQLRRLDRNP
jgi:hypothetical protein